MLRMFALTSLALWGGLAHAQDSPAFNGNPFFLIKLTPIRGLAAAKSPTAQEQVLLGEHAAYVHRLRADKKLLIAGSSVADPDAIELIIIQVPSTSDAQRVLAADPSVKGGMFRGEVRPFRLDSYR